MGELHAWVDESGSDRRRDPNTYLLVAALCPQDAMEDVRATMAPLRIGGHNKLHWREETKPARRQLITEAVRSCAIEHLIVIRNGADGETRERPRRMALRRLLLELDQHEVAHAIFEARGPKDDAKDRDVHNRMRQQQEIRGGLRVSHAPGPTDPGLWVADAVAGAVVAARTGTPEYFEHIRDQVTEITLDWTQ